MTKIVTRITATGYQKSSTVDVEKLCDGELVVRFNGSWINRTVPPTEISVYITNGSIVIHLISKKNGKHRDDCLSLDGDDIHIMGELINKLRSAACVKNWRDDAKRTYEPKE